MSIGKLSIISLTAIFALNLLVSILIPPQAAALSGSDFNAGRIIDDEIFYNKDAMSAAQIQTFLNSKLPVCDTNGDKLVYDSAYGDTVTRKVYSQRRGVSTPFICLKSYSQNTPTMESASGLCNEIPGGQKNAATIINDVAKACGINPQVLLVLLQKEQSLVTDDWPWPVQYEKATGFSCPDTAACNPDFAGFFYQVYYAARQFKVYAKYPDSYNYKAGRNNYIYYNPNLSACGGSTVFIQNQATASLYIYTPYQPNKAALNNLYGLGDNCSAYGNRNFWRMFSDWFGPTLGTPFFKIDDENTVYINGAGNTYYSISNYNDLLAYGWKVTTRKIANYPSSYLNGRTFVGTLPRTANFEGSTIYLVDRGLLHPFDTPEMLNHYGYQLGNHARLPALSFGYFVPSSKAASIGVGDAGKKFFIQNGTKRFIVDDDAYRSGTPAYSTLAGTGLSEDLLSRITNQSPIWKPGTLLKSHDNNTVYFIKDSNSRIQIYNKQTLDDLGYDFSDVFSVRNDFIKDYVVSSQQLSPFIRKDDGTLYLIGPFGSKQIVSNELASEIYYNVNMTQVPLISNEIVDRLTLSKNASKLIRPTDGKTVYRVINGLPIKIESAQELFDLGYTFADVADVSPLLYSYLIIRI